MIHLLQAHVIHLQYRTYSTHNSESQQIWIFTALRNLLVMAPPLPSVCAVTPRQTDQVYDRFQRRAQYDKTNPSRSVFSSARADRVLCFSRRPRGMNRLGSCTALLASHCSLLSLAPGRTPVAYLAGRGAVQSNWQAWKIMLMECDREWSISFIPHS